MTAPPTPHSTDSEQELPSSQFIEKTETGFSTVRVDHTLRASQKSSSIELPGQNTFVSTGLQQPMTAIRLGNHNYSIAPSTISKVRTVSGTRTLETTRELKLKLNSAQNKKIQSRNIQRNQKDVIELTDQKGARQNFI